MLIIKFKFQLPQVWNFDQHFLQSIFYNAIKQDDKLKDVIHGYRYGLFTFSNIYPYKKNENFNTKDTYQIRFNSISEDVNLAVVNYFLTNKKIPFGAENHILIDKITYHGDNKFYSGKIIKTITPVVVSINQNLALKYSIPFNVKDKRPLYWNKNMGFEIFKEQLKANTLRKYIKILKLIMEGKINVNENVKSKFSKLDNWEFRLLSVYDDKQQFKKYIEDIELFSAYKFISGALWTYKGGKIAGSRWEFKLNFNQEKVDISKLFTLINLIGLGEKTSAGFGFIN